MGSRTQKKYERRFGAKFSKQTMRDMEAAEVLRKRQQDQILREQIDKMENLDNEEEETEPE